MLNFTETTASQIHIDSWFTWRFRRKKTLVDQEVRKSATFTPPSQMPYRNTLAASTTWRSRPWKGYMTQLSPTPTTDLQSRTVRQLPILSRKLALDTHISEILGSTVCADQAASGCQVSRQVPFSNFDIKEFCREILSFELNY